MSLRLCTMMCAAKRHLNNVIITAARVVYNGMLYWSVAGTYNTGLNHNSMCLGLNPIGVMRLYRLLNHPDEDCPLHNSPSLSALGVEERR